MTTVNKEKSSIFYDQVYKKGGSGNIYLLLQHFGENRARPV